ncbi:MAG: hypothetical protein R3350_01655 [Saprospiraceae bacterium]|nr:hypothetical protein [Saprospiraceae bacterium]
MTQENETNAKGCSSRSWLLLIVLALAMLYFALRQLGVDVFYKTEETEIIDRPHD